MAMQSNLDPDLKSWLNRSVYPRLSHDLVFGGLPGYTKAQHSDTHYADCPRCHRKGAFYCLPGRQAGQCSSCSTVLGWFGFLRFRARSEAAAITEIASLAGVPMPSTRPTAPTRPPTPGRFTSRTRYPTRGGR